MNERTYIIRGELVDTYGGDYTYRDTWLEIEEDGMKHIFQECYGAKSSEPEEIHDYEEVEFYLNMLTDYGEAQW